MTMHMSPSFFDSLTGISFQEQNHLVQPYCGQAILRHHPISMKSPASHIGLTLPLGTRDLTRMSQKSSNRPVGDSGPELLGKHLSCKNNMGVAGKPAPRSRTPPSPIPPRCPPQIWDSQDVLPRGPHRAAAAQTASEKVTCYEHPLATTVRETAAVISQTDRSLTNGHSAALPFDKFSRFVSTRQPSARSPEASAIRYGEHYSSGQGAKPVSERSCKRHEENGAFPTNASVRLGGGEALANNERQKFGSSLVESTSKIQPKSSNSRFVSRPSPSSSSSKPYFERPPNIHETQHNINTTTRLGQGGFTEEHSSARFMNERPAEIEVRKNGLPSWSEDGRRVGESSLLHEPMADWRKRVTVQCMSFDVRLAVNNCTSSFEVISAFANVAAGRIDVAKFSLDEVYTLLGLKRRLRQYELVGDVMDSWDSDRQNLLRITSDNEFPKEYGLDLTAMHCSHAPYGFILPLYHSSRPKKWNKRWITLLNDGQILASKKPDGGGADREHSHLCDLTHFDIYTPTDEMTIRRLKPPARFCYAIKSQQKMEMFPGGLNFVHFFSTADGKVAQRFHELVHYWRSWFLVNRNLQSTSSKVRHESHKTSNKSVNINHQRQNISAESVDSIESVPHWLNIIRSEPLGTSPPLIDMEVFHKHIDEFDKKCVQDAMAHILKPREPLRGESRSAQPDHEVVEDNLKELSYLSKAVQKSQSLDRSISTKTGSAISAQAAPNQSPWFPSAVAHTARLRRLTAKARYTTDYEAEKTASHGNMTQAMMASDLKRHSWRSGRGRRFGAAALNGPGVANSTRRSHQNRPQQVQARSQLAGHADLPCIAVPGLPRTRMSNQSRNGCQTRRRHNKLADTRVYAMRPRISP